MAAVAANGFVVGDDERDGRHGAPPVGAAGARSLTRQETGAKEEELIQQMRAALGECCPEAKDVDDATLMRFLLARQKRVDRATDMFVTHYKWRQTYVPLGYISEEEISNELAAEKVFLQGRDKLGRPIGVVQAAKHDANKRNLEEFKKYCVYNFDKLVASMNSGEEQFCAIVELSGLTYKNLDPRGWTVIFDFMQAHYPERLGRIFLIHAPYIFWGAWKIVNRFIDKRTRDKIKFVEDKNVEEVLFKEIDKEQLPKFCGGKLELVLIQDAPTPNWPPQRVDNAQSLSL